MKHLNNAKKQILDACWDCWQNLTAPTANAVHQLTGIPRPSVSYYQLLLEVNGDLVKRRRGKAWSPIMPALLAELVQTASACYLNGEEEIIHAAVQQLKQAQTAHERQS